MYVCASFGMYLCRRISRLFFTSCLVNPYRNDSVFKEVIEEHFLHHEKKIIETVSQWKDEADMVALELKEVCM